MECLKTRPAASLIDLGIYVYVRVEAGLGGGLVTLQGNLKMFGLHLDNLLIYIHAYVLEWCLKRLGTQWCGHDDSQRPGPEEPGSVSG